MSQRPLSFESGLSAYLHLLALLRKLCEYFSRAKTICPGKSYCYQGGEGLDVSSLRTDEELTEIYQHHVDTVYRVALMLLKSVPEAEDITQTVFIRLMRDNTRFESDEHLKAWLIVCARNCCRDELKSWWRTKRADAAGLAEPGCVQESPQGAVWEKLTALEGKYRLPVYLHYYEGYKTEEIAVLLGVKPATVRTRLRTARKKLKLLLEEDGEYASI
jgi:RNA polymerase sigma-70 factor (ECF subfamily)